MGTIQEIENAIRRLSPNELAAFREWFAEFDAERWDRQIDQNIADGGLDHLANEAIHDMREGRCSDL